MLDEQEEKSEVDADPELCTLCERKAECFSREDNDPHILEAQFYHCYEVVGRADFKPDEDWVVSFYLN